MGHGHCSVVCCLSDLLQLSESWRNHYIREVCSANRWNAQQMQCLQQALVNRKGPIFLRDDARLHVAQPMLQKWNELCCEVLSHLPYSPDFWPTDYHFFKDLNNFLQGQRFHNQQEAENAFQEFVKSRSVDFYAIGIKYHLSSAKMCSL